MAKNDQKKYSVKKKILKTFSSKYNGTIELRWGKGGYMLVVDGFLQSGPYIEALWDEAFEKLLPDAKIHNILILGFGAGSIMKPLKNHWPESEVHGVEIDPQIIQIAKNYFPQNVAGVSVKNSDAMKFFRDIEKKITFDLVIVDCYIGGTIQDSLKTITFLQSLKIISKRVLFNQLFLPNNRSEMGKIAFLPDLDKVYPVQALKLPYNIIIEF